MSTSNAQLVRRLYTDFFNTGRLDQLGEVVAPEFVGAGPGRGPAAFAAVITELRGAFPDLIYTVDDIVADGDRVAVRWTWRGTHQHAFRGMAPTGKPVTSTGLGIFQVTSGKVARAWIETDRLGFLQAIGAVSLDPAFVPPAPPKQPQPGTGAN
jgi:steroid delta-isomerase-like uncharacterized protein